MLNPHHNKSVTLIELLIAMILISLLVVGFSSLEFFSRRHVVTSDRLAKLQNEVSYLLGHMAKNIGGTESRGGAVGSIDQLPVTTNSIGGDHAIQIWIDYNSNGQRDTGDKQITYRYRAANYEIWYYPNYTDNPNDSDAEVITQRKISPDFSTNAAQPTHITYSVNNNYIGIQATACWDPDGNPNACGTTDNPSITMSTRIKMPSVSTN